LNRSKLRFTKEATPFLKEPSYQIANCVPSLPPNVESLKDLNGKKLQDYLHWDEELVVDPRAIEPLLSESDFRMMKSHTFGLVQKARAAEQLVACADFRENKSSQNGCAGKLSQAKMRHEGKH
jgi:hypothetical protein